VLDRYTQELDGDDATASVAQSLERLQLRGARVRVACGVPIGRSYLATRPINSSGGVPSAKVLLRESLQTAASSVDRMVADVVTSRPEKRELASIAACPREMASSLHVALEALNLRLARIEPAPCALLRVARSADRESHKQASVLRIFLGEKQAVGVLASSGCPIAWRTVALTQGDEAATILSLVRSLLAVAKPSGLESTPQSVVVHGRKDLERLVDTEWVCQQVGVPFRWVDRPGLNPDEIALGLAEGVFDDSGTGFDLARDARRQPTLRELFPWAEAALYVAILLVFAGFLWFRKLDRDQACAVALSSPDAVAMGGASIGEMEQTKRDLQARVSGVQRFVESRVTWSAYLRELSASLPDNVYLTSLSGDAELKTSKKGKTASKRSLVIRGAVSLPESGLIPHEIDVLVDRIRSHPVLTRDFPVVELADLKRFQQVGDETGLAMFTLVCLPKGAKTKK
jgi:hypothetical protein